MNVEKEKPDKSIINNRIVTSVFGTILTITSGIIIALQIQLLNDVAEMKTAKQVQANRMDNVEKEMIQFRISLGEQGNVCYNRYISIRDILDEKRYQKKGY